MARRIGIDIGTTAVRAVEVSGLDREGYAVISRVGIHPLPEGAVRGGKVRRPAPVAMAVQQAMKQARMPANAVVLGIGAPEVAVKRHRVPSAVKAAERLEVVRTSNQEISPLIKMPEAVLSVNHIRQDVTGDGHSYDELVVGACRQSDVDDMMNLCKLAKLVPRAIDLSGVALLRALVRVPESSRDIATVVDVGATMTTVVTREGPHVRSLRAIPTGGSDITHAIREARGEGYDAADRRKQSMRLGRTSSHSAGPVDTVDTYGLSSDDQLLDDRTQTKAEEAFERAGEELLNAIANSVEHDGNTHGSFTQAISLTGGTALLGGLKEQLQQRVGVPVQIGRPWATVAPHKRNAMYRRDGRDDPVLLMTLSNAIGLALWREA